MGGEHLKVLHIISGNDDGGGGNHVLNLCTFGSCTMESVLGCIGGGPLYEKSKNSSVNTVIFSMKDILKELPQYIRGNKIDIVDFHGAKPFLIHRMIRNKLSVPAVATVHSDYRYDFLNSRVKYYIFTPLSSIGLRSFKYYVCVSEYIREILASNGFKGRKYVVNNGIDFDNIYISKSRDVIRKSLNIGESDFVYVCVARMHPVKNHKALLKAFGKLRNEISHIKLVLVGDGELKSELVELAEKLNVTDDVLFTGFRNNPVDYAAASDISILVSLNEGGAPPLSVLESAAVKKTIIASRVGDLQYILNDENGFLIETNNVEAIYERMKEACLSKNEVEARGERLYELVKHEFTMKGFCDKYFKSYSEILKDNREA